MGRIGAAASHSLRRWRDVTTRERDYLIDELAQVRGLMPLLMKRRNVGRWSPEDRLELRAHLRRLSILSPYIALSVVPGSFIVLPVLAWWLDRRRGRHLATHGIGPCPPARASRRSDAS
jgi:hypothetical protein